MPDRADAPRPERFTLGRIAPDAYARILLAVGLTFFVLHKLRDWSGPWTSADPLGPVSALELVEAAILVSLCGRMRRSPTLAVEELAIVVLSLCLGAALGGPKLAFGLATLAFAVRLWSVPGARPAILGLLTLCAQLAASAGPLFAVHRALGSIDAAVVRYLTRAGGHETTGAGPVVIAPDGSFAIDVNSGCASSYVALGVIAGFVLIVLWRRGRLVRGDLGWAALLIALVTILNWARLVPMVFSREAHLFWHDDLGAQIVALVDGALTCGLAVLATGGREPKVRVVRAP